MARIIAKCRHCGTKVSYFGEICQACTAGAEAMDLLEQEPDLITRLNHMCDDIITSRMGES